PAARQRLHCKDRQPQSRRLCESSRPVHIILPLPCGEQKHQNPGVKGLGNDRRQSQQSRMELGLLTRIAATESVTLCVRMKTWRRFWNLNQQLGFEIRSAGAESPFKTAK